MKKSIRLISLVLAMLLLPMVGGCTFGNKKPKLPDKQKVNHVYRYDTKVIAEIDNSDGNTYINTQAANETAYAYVLVENEEDYTKTRQTLHIGDYTTDRAVLLAETDENENDYFSCNGICLLEDCVLVNLYKSSYDTKTDTYSSESVVSIYNLDGSYRGDLDLNKVFNVADFPMGDTMCTDGKIVYQRIWGGDSFPGVDVVAFTPDGEAVGQYSFLPEGADGYVDKIFPVGGKLVAAVETYNSDNYTCKFVTLDPRTGERTESGNIDASVMWSAFADASGSVFYSDEQGIYRYNPDTKEKTELMNFINSDYIYRYGGFSALEDGRFFSVADDYKDDKILLTCSVFEPVPDEEVSEKYLITVASAGYAYNLQEQIVKFNLASDEYRICYKDYTQYNTDEDYTLAAATLNQDLLKGEIPDILIADNQFNISKYINKGIFADLYTFLDKDETLKRTDFLDNVLSACEINGKLYAIPTNIYLLGLLGKKELLDEYRGLNVRQFVDKVHSLPEGVTFFREGDASRDDMLQQFFFINYVNFYNAATGACSLNNDDFKAILEFVSEQPEKSMWEDMDHDSFDWDAYENLFRDGKAIASLTSLAGFDAFENSAYQFGTDEVDFIGFPAPDGDGIVFASSNLSFAISANSPFADAAWDFVKIFYTDDYQTEQDWGFPVMKSALEQEKNEALEKIKKREENGDEPEVIPFEKRIASSTMAVTDIAEEPMDANHKLTAEDVERVYALVLGVRKQLIFDQDIFDIIKEEASAFFAGKKSLDEVASLAENRVNIKLSESR